MEYKFTLQLLKKQLVTSLLLLGMITVSGQANGPALEMAAGSGNPTGNGPTTTNQTIYFQNNTDNTGAGTTFATYAPTLSATYALSNIRTGNIINFGQTTTGATLIYDLMTNQGAPANANFTSAGASAGTGIVVANNSAVRLYVQTVPLRTANRPTNSTTDIADLTITFNRPVNNPVIHIGGLGGTSNSTPALGFSGILDLTSFVGTGVSLSRLSGNGTTSFQASATNISNGSATFTSSGANSGSGSVRVNGTGITSLTFKISLKGDGANPAVTAWAPDNNATVGEAFTVGFSTLESDIQLTKTMANTTAAAGSTTNFVITATNNGPSNNANINISDILPTGYSYNGTPTASTGTYSTVTGVWNIPTLNNAASATLTIPVNVLATGNYINTATVTSATVADSNTGNNRATAARVPDSDRDGIFDNVDLDDDNDGIPDTVEDNCTKPNQIVNGNFSGSATSWASGFYTTPNTTGGLTFTGTALDILVDNAGSLYSGNIILANTTPVNLRAGVLYNFSSTLNILSGTTNTNFAWVLIDASNNIVQTLQTYKTLVTGVGNVQITNTATAYPISFFSTGTGSYRLAMTWITNSAASGNAQDVRIDDVTLFAPCDEDGDGISNYLDLDSDADGCFDAIEGDENVLPSQLNADGSINTTSTGGVGTTAGTNNGIPNLVNTGVADTGGDSGQGAGASQNASVNLCLDSDNDGVPNDIDLDDDNDGILDIDENCNPYLAQNIAGVWKGKTVSNLTVSLPGSAPQANVGELSDGQNRFHFNQSGATTRIAGSGNITYTYTFSTPVPANEIAFFIVDLDPLFGTVFPTYQFNINGGPANGRFEAVNFAGTGPYMNFDAVTGLLTVPDRAVDDYRILLKGRGTQLVSSITITSTGISAGDLVAYSLFGLNECDTDNDTIPNRLDLDSDADGCFDAVEGDENVSLGQLNANGSINTGITGGIGSTFNVNAGVPNLVNSGGTSDIGSDVGQGIGTSQNASAQDAQCNGFGCTPTMYLSQTATLYTVGTSTNPFTYPPVGTASVNYNAIGLNPINGLIYGIQVPSSNNVLVINTDGSATNLGAVSGLPAGVTYNAGEIDNLGNFYVKENSNNNQLYKINLSTMTATPTTLTTSINIADLAFSVTSGLLYAVNSTDGQLVSINPTSGTVTPIGAAPGAISFGAMFGSSTGELYGSDNAGGFYQFNLATGQRVLISGSPASNANDGAHCVTAPIAFSADLSITKTDGSTTYASGTNVTYTVTVTNNGPFGVLNASVSDPVPAGIPAANVSYTAVVSSGSTTTVAGTQTGAINDLVGLPVGGTVTYTVVVSVPFAYNGNLVNTATVTAPSNISDANLTNNTATDTDTQAVCYKPTVTAGTILSTNHGITSLGRAGNDASGANWPMVRKGAWTVLESKTKGFVLNRLTTAQIAAIPAADLVEGMMVYNVTLDCLQLNTNGTPAGWSCFNTQTCPSN